MVRIESVEEAITLDKEHFRKGKTELFPKKSIAIGVNEEFRDILGIEEGKEFILTGEGFLPSDFILGRRTVFLENPISINGETYFIEVKGYGLNGRELFGHKHLEGDLYYGMFLDNAKKEFFFPEELTNYGVKNIQRPVALFKFSEEVFIEEVLKTLPVVLEARIKLHQERVRRTAMRLFPQLGKSLPGMGKKERFMYWNDNETQKIALEISSFFKKIYKTEGKTGIRGLARALNLRDELEGLLDGREAGYVLRAVKSPLRVGSGSEKNVNEKTVEIAKNMGRLSRKLLELGFFNVSPNPGNWTMDGELVDFEDVIKISEGRKELQETYTFWKKQEGSSYGPAIKREGLDGLIEMSYGEFMIGAFASYFQEGFIGHSTDTEEVIIEAKKIIESTGELPVLN